MGRLTSLLLLFLLTQQSLSTAPKDWPETIQLVKKSLVRLTGDPITQTVDGETLTAPAVCTGFVVDQLRRFIGTAAHCPSRMPHLTVDGKQARVVWSNGPLDLALVEAPGVSKPALRGSVFGGVRIGQELGVLGYGYGRNEPLFRSGRVSDQEGSWDDAPGDFLTLDQTFLRGMSGGPVFDLDGQVRGVIVSASHETGWARPVRYLLEPIEVFPFPSILP